jgi:hypothetical protein
VDKEEALFYRHSRTADGLQPWCKSCQADRDNEVDGRPRTRLKGVRRATSPYTRMADVLRNIEEHANDPSRVAEIIAVARKTYRLPT